MPNDVEIEQTILDPLMNFPQNFVCSLKIKKTQNNPHKSFSENKEKQNPQTDRNLFFPSSFILLLLGKEFFI